MVRYIVMLEVAIIMYKCMYVARCAVAVKWCLNAIKVHTGMFKRILVLLQNNLKHFSKVLGD